MNPTLPPTITPDPNSNVIEVVPGRPRPMVQLGVTSDCLSEQPSMLIGEPANDNARGVPV